MNSMRTESAQSSLERYPQLSWNVGRAVSCVFIAIAFWTVICVPYLNLSLMTGNSALDFSFQSASNLIVLALSIVIAAACIYFALVRGGAIAGCLQRIVEMTARFSTAYWLTGMLAIGIGLRLVWLLVFDAPLRSDFATYYGLARKLYEDGSYLDPRGDYAYWPPGYPFWLYLNFFVFGVQRWVPAVSNLLLFVVSLASVYVLASKILGLTLRGWHACW